MGETGSRATELGALQHVVAPMADVLIALDGHTGGHRGALTNHVFL